MNNSYVRSTLLRSLASLQAALTIFALVAMSSPLMVYAQETPEPPQSEETEQVEEQEEVIVEEQDEESSDEQSEDQAPEEQVVEDESLEANVLGDITVEGRPSPKVDICHNGNVISVDESGWGGHSGHTEDFLVDDEQDELECESPRLIVKKVIVGNPNASANDFSFDLGTNHWIAQDETDEYSFEADGENVIFTKKRVSGGIQYPKYTVTEDAEENYTTTYAGDCTDVVFTANAQKKTCTVTNTYTGPTEPETPKSCEILSNEIDFVVEKDANAVETWAHNAWADFVGGMWIWGDAQTADPEADETQTFKKNFTTTNLPTAATLTLAADNGARVLVNGHEVLDQLDGLDADDKNYDDPAEVVNILPHLVVGNNTLEIIVTNLAYDTTDPHTNPAGLNYKISMTGADCDESEYSPEPEAPTATLHATKIVCDSEEYLPNRSGGADITATTATEFLAEGDNAEHCRLEDGWQFEWVTDADSNTNPGDNAIGAVGGDWNLFGPTNANGTTTTEVPAGGKVWVREVNKVGYQPFASSLADSVSAEFWCSTDVLNYDNWDWIDPVNEDGHYYCVAFNALTEDICEPEAQTVLLSSDDDVNGLVTDDESGPASVVSWLHASWLQEVGEWIWKDTATSADDAANGTEETFTRTFTIVGTPKDSTLEIAADNQYQVYVNGDLLVTDVDEMNYGATVDYSIPAAMLQGGANTITFVITNIDHATENTPALNPAGLLYKITVNNDECDPYEPPAPKTATVTMCKAEFDENLENEGSYPTLPGWTLMLLGADVENLSVPSTNSSGVNTVNALDDDTSYVAVASGTWNNQGGANVVDAEYSSTDGWATQMDGYTGYQPDILELQIDEAFDADGNNWGPYSSTHQYARSFMPNTDGAVNFRIFDGSGTTQNEGWFGDNSGSLSVDLNKGYAGVTGQNGCVTFTNVPHGTYTIGEVNQPGWSFHGLYGANNQQIAGLQVVVNEASEEFTILNSFDDDGGNGGDDEEGQITIVKNTVGGNGTFTFDIDKELIAGDVEPDVTLTTVEGSDSETTTVDTGSYVVTENPQEGWTLQSVSCVYESESELTTETALDNSFVIEDGDHVICTFTNTKNGEETETSHTTVVREADLASDNADAFLTPDDWFFWNDQNGSVDGPEGVNNSVGSFVNGPETAPLGAGSAQISAPSGETALPLNQQARRNIATYQFKNVPLAAITDLSFSTYSQSAGNGSPASERSAYLQFNVDFANNDTWQRRLVFLPAANGAVVNDEWQNWDAINGGAAQWLYSGNNWPAGAVSNGSIPGTTARSWNAILADYPNAETRATDSWLGFRIGEPYADGFTGNVDNFVIGIDGGTNTHTETFDFEPDAITPQDNDDNDDNNNDGNTGGRVRGASSNGLVLGATTECSVLLNDFLGKSYANPSGEVSKLQNFLNTEVGAALPITGVFGPMTEAAVRTFQVKYWEDVLKPWFSFPEYGVLDSDDSTGIVYKTTKWKINEIFCPGSEALPTLP